jgi:CheY-like chemotaxis protein
VCSSDLITPIVSDALNLLNPTLPPNVALIQDFSENLKPVVADPVHIHQVVLNLCTNAIHAMESGGGKFRVGLSEIKLDGGDAAGMNVKPGCYICLDVEDSGIGMDAKTLEKIFDPYFTTKEFGKGAGMGLAVVHGIVHGCGGAIRVESTPGKGSLFRIFLPCSETLIIHDVSEDPVDKGTERILFVDDDPDIAELTEETLGGMGYRMTIALSGSDALALFRKDPSAFDLMITDLTMPDMSGEDLAEAVHTLREDLPVILCTGYNSYTPDKDSKKTGIRDILIKPVHSVDLAESIRSVLTGSKRSGETSSITKECLH